MRYLQPQRTKQESWDERELCGGWEGDRQNRSGGQPWQGWQRAALPNLWADLSYALPISIFPKKLPHTKEHEMRSWPLCPLMEALQSVASSPGGRQEKKQKKAASLPLRWIFLEWRGSAVNSTTLWTQAEDRSMTPLRQWDPSPNPPLLLITTDAEQLKTQFLNYEEEKGSISSFPARKAKEKKKRWCS